jgi:RNA polymerase sigma factor (sigma-70 family)
MVKPIYRPSFKVTITDLDEDRSELDFHYKQKINGSTGYVDTPDAALVHTTLVSRRIFTGEIPIPKENWNSAARAIGDKYFTLTGPGKILQNTSYTLIKENPEYIPNNNPDSFESLTFSDLEGLIEDRKKSTLSREEEQLFFRSLQFYIQSTHEHGLPILESDSTTRGFRSEVVSLVTNHNSARKFIDEGIRLNKGLFSPVASKLGITFDEAMERGYLTLLRSIKKFDPNRGIKFSTYACTALFKDITRELISDKKHTRYLPLSEYYEKNTMAERRREEEINLQSEMAQEILSEKLAGLTEREELVISQRFSSKPLTLEETGKLLGVSKERVRQFQVKALNKLRLALHIEFEKRYGDKIH